MARNIDVTCPCCATRLTIDPDSGDVLAEERPAPDHDKTFESAMSEVQGGERRREDLFTKAFDRTRRLDDVLAKKFEEAKKKAEKDPHGKPRGPFDVD
jgi:hypothetical protein